VPAGVDPAEAAALILGWATPYQLLHPGAPGQRGQRALVNGAAGAVRQAPLLLGQKARNQAWGTPRGPPPARVPGLGATPIDYQREDFTQVLPGGFDVVFDGVGQDGYWRSFTALKHGGVLCVYGYSAGVREQSRLLPTMTWLAREYLEYLGR